MLGSRPRIALAGPARYPVAVRAPRSGADIIGAMDRGGDETGGYCASVGRLTSSALAQKRAKQGSTLLLDGCESVAGAERLPLDSSHSSNSRVWRSLPLLCLNSRGGDALGRAECRLAREAAVWRRVSASRLIVVQPGHRDRARGRAHTSAAKRLRWAAQPWLRGPPFSSSGSVTSLIRAVSSATRTAVEPASCSSRP